MSRLLQIIDRFFFARISASGFGLLRIAWGGIVFTYGIRRIPDVVRYYSSEGLLPLEFGHLVFRDAHRFSLLDAVTEPSAVVVLYGILLFTTLCMTLGLQTRLMTVLSVLLLFSFQERNLLPLTGGDTLLRNIGFILMIAPEIDAFSLTRLREQWRRWSNERRLRPPLTMHVWPYRLLLWQFLILYLTSGWDKLQGDMWTTGTAVAAIFHHPHFFRFPEWLADTLVPLSPLFSRSFLAYEWAWALLLIPRPVWKRLLPQRLLRHSLKRWILLAGVLLHCGILLLMEVGPFSLVVMAGFLGLLTGEDFAAIRRVFNRRRRGRIAVLYDSACRLCRRSMFAFLILDHLRRLKAVDFRDPQQHRRFAPDVSEEELDRAMHIRFLKDSGETEDSKDSEDVPSVPPEEPSVSEEAEEAKEAEEVTFKGFDAFRVLTHHIPLLWPLVPFLYLPGAAPLGRRIYAHVAAKRAQCADGVCRHEEH